MMCALVSVLILTLLATASVADERPEGLLWHRSDLPATLPLQVKTGAEADYLLRLQNVETEKIVLAAYIRGGEYFRVLVPPGQYALLFDAGTDWRGEEALFGPGTRSFALKDPLSFGAGLSTKHGHLVDLTDGADVVVRDFALCQRQAFDFRSLLRPAPSVTAPRGHPGRQTGSPRLYPRYPADQLDARPDPRPLPAREFLTPRYELRSRVCD